MSRQWKLTGNTEDSLTACDMSVCTHWR